VQNVVDNRYSFDYSHPAPLRPLWPALGIIGVFVVVGIKMLISFIVESLWEKKKLRDARSPLDSPGMHSDFTMKHTHNPAAICSYRPHRSYYKNISVSQCL
jgi:hypothetical protein